MSIVHAKIYRQTISGQYWVGRAESGQDLLFSIRDQRLGIGTEVDVNGIRKGKNIDFPVRYDLRGQLRVRTPIATGVIIEDRVSYGYLTEYWDTVTDFKDCDCIFLNKMTGSSDVNFGTMIEIYGMMKKGTSHAFVDRWKKADRQFPEEPLTDEQKAMAERLASGLTFPETGTVAIMRPPFETVVLDEMKMTLSGTYRTRELIVPLDGEFPIGARVLIGTSKQNPPRTVVHKL